MRKIRKFLGKGHVRVLDVGDGKHGALVLEHDCYNDTKPRNSIAELLILDEAYELSGSVVFVPGASEDDDDEEEAAAPQPSVQEPTMEAAGEGKRVPLARGRARKSEDASPSSPKKQSRVPSRLDPVIIIGGPFEGSKGTLVGIDDEDAIVRLDPQHDIKVLPLTFCAKREVEEE